MGDLVRRETGQWYEVWVGGLDGQADDVAVEEAQVVSLVSAEGAVGYGCTDEGSEEFGVDGVILWWLWVVWGVGVLFVGPGVDESMGKTFRVRHFCLLSVGLGGVGEGRQSSEIGASRRKGL